MRARVFSLRTAKEILQDPVNLFFGLGFPLIPMAVVQSLVCYAGAVALGLKI